MDWAHLVVGLDREDREKITDLATQVARFRGDNPPPWSGPDGLAQMLARLAITAVKLLPEPALEGARESLALYTLNNLAIHLDALGRPGDAVAVAAESVQVCRAADLGPPKLAQAANTLGRVLSSAGRQTEALDASDEALALYRNLYATDPVEYAPLLADAWRAGNHPQ